MMFKSSTNSGNYATIAHIEEDESQFPQSSPQSEKSYTLNIIENHKAITLAERLKGFQWKPIGPKFQGSVSNPLWLLMGLIYAVLLSFTFIFSGLLIASHSTGIPSEAYDSNSNLHLNLGYWYREAILLLINTVLLKPALLCIGIVHENTLKWTLATEEERFKENKIRLEFNSNFRFLAASIRTWSINGLPATALMAVSLAITYAASSMVLLQLEDTSSGYNTVASFFSLIVIGVFLLIQSIYALLAMRTVAVPTWNTSPLTTAHILSHNGLLKRHEGRCMLSLADQFKSGARRPNDAARTPAWDCHDQYARYVGYILVLVGSGFYWGLVFMGMVKSGTQGSRLGTSYSPLINISTTPVMNFSWNGEAPIAGLVWGLAIQVGFMGGIVTTALTCTETLVASTYDERLWGEIAHEKGSDHSPTFWKKYVVSWQPLAILMAEPVFHWLFGLAAGVSADTGFHVRPLQVFYLSGAGMLGLGIIFGTAKFPRKTLCPKTFGHLQTIVNLVDVWPGTLDQKMYWGKKEIRAAENSETATVYHAGTSIEKDGYLLSSVMNGMAERAVLDVSQTREASSSVVCIGKNSDILDTGAA
ncbi:hypothetical protein BDP27DRAFT_1298581 [Rhodocollybia butyracea]|uniref:Uncharacterized protein n=1 Tax=Rhodocollybia butyracea TaxID=206335 RepID=A0A9P5PKK8_9AGAR|nr:hypothetical protein BDP27DRAFT_1298581 [Rhodocollybia butyracea]